MSGSLSVACPAGREIDPPGLGFTVLCGVIERENREEGGPEVRPLVPLRDEPHSVIAYCCAAEPLSIDARPVGSTARTGYVFCPVWRSECARREKGLHEISADDVMFGGSGNRL